MSHFTTVETKINDLVALKAALVDLKQYCRGLLASLAEGNVISRIVESGDGRSIAVVNQPTHGGGWVATHEDITSRIKAEAKIKGSKSYDIGLQLTEEGNYKLVADWWGIEEETEQTQEQVMQKIVQRYAYHKVKNEVAKQGFQLDEEQVEADGTIKLGVSRW